MGRAFQSLGELGAYVVNSRVPIHITDPGVPLYNSVTGIDGIWASQPSVRKVVDFIASNVASIPFHVYERVSDTNRRRVTNHPLADTLATPVPSLPNKGAVTAYRFWHSILVDWLLWDKWAAAKIEQEGKTYLQRIPARRFRLAHDGLDRVTSIVVYDDFGMSRDNDPGDFVWDAGYTDPGATGQYADSGAGCSPMTTIAQILAEYSEAVTYRRSVWAHGARIPAVLEREQPWSSDAARTRFEQSWKTFVSGGGAEGGTPVLEDGMKLKSFDAFKPQETGDLEGRRLTDIEVASFYHIAPELVGARQGNYSNMDAFRQGLYRESLGPYIWQLTQVINLNLTTELAGTRPLYVEPNLEAKLAGSFIEQAAVFQSATGAPYMLRSEARARLNLPAVAGLDKPVVPLNVLVGGQASPRDSGTQNLNARPAVRWKARPGVTYETKLFQILTAFFRRQRVVVAGKLTAKAAADWWDEERWNRELGADLYQGGTLVATQAAQATLDALAIDPDTYDEDRTLAYLTEMSSGIGKRVNAITEQQIEDALDEDEPMDAFDALFDEAESSRAEMLAGALVTTYAGWGTLEAGRQAGGEGMTKTWITGANPRPDHAALDGETVLVAELFSNGSMWPGDGADSEYGCNCDLQLTVP